MTLQLPWAVLRENAHVILAIATGLVIVVSLLRRKRRPSNEELTKLGKSLLGTASSIFVIAWLVARKNSELDGFGLILMAGLIPYCWHSLCTGYDTVIQLWTPDVPAIPPAKGEAGKADEALVAAKAAKVESTSAKDAEQIRISTQTGLPPEDDGEDPAPEVARRAALERRENDD